MEESLPQFIVKDILRKESRNKLRDRPTSERAASDVFDGAVREALKSSFDERGLSAAQKERIATAVLKGEYSVSSSNETMNANHVPRAVMKARADGNLQRHKFKPVSLGVVSTPAYLLEPEVNSKRRKEIERCKKLGKGTSEYRFGTKTVPAVEVHVPRADSLGTLKAEKDANLTSHRETVAQSKTEMIKKNIAQVKSLRDTVREHNEEYSSSRRKEIQYRRKVNAFRQKLFERLKEKNDPQIRDIMRVIDDHTIECFIERFKGCSMTVDAVLAYIGDTLPLQRSNKSVANMSGVLPNSELTEINMGRTGETGVFQFNASVFECDGSERPGSVSMDDVSRFKKITQSCPRSNSPKKRGLGALGSTKHSCDPFTVATPGQYPVVSRAAGFRPVKTDLPFVRSFTSTSPSKAKDIWHKVVSTAPTNSERSSSPGVLIGQGQHQSVCSMEISDSRPCSPPTAYFMNAIKTELAASGNLQSVQPDKVLTDEELLDLAAHDKTFDSIADSLSCSSGSSKRRNSLKTRKQISPRHLGQVVVGSRKPPRALKTVPAVLDGNPDCTPVPYSKHIMSPNHSRKLGGRERPKTEAHMLEKAVKLPLSSTNYGDLYVVSSYKSPTDPSVINRL
mmetsp:Transcript_16021/g.24164  ORF Transcript_16021/g.24164 Transcript_16021/m.24164 type:complete len:622 (-) Transcript_16021:86-1951(-)